MQTTSKPGVSGLIAMAQVAGMQRSIDFYRLLGMEIRGSERNPAGELQWVSLACDQAELMLSRASQPVVAKQQAVCFYFDSSDLVGLREHLLANGVQASAITYPFFMPKGEMELEDPDGYPLYVGQAG